MKDVRAGVLVTVDGEKRVKVDDNESMTALSARDRRALLLFALVVCAISTLGGFIGGKPLEGLLIGPAAVVAMIVGFFLLLAVFNLPTAFHELGHYVAGRAVGYRFGQVMVGPFGLTKNPDGLKFKLDFTRISSQGQIFMEAPDGTNVVRRFRWIVLGGPIASLTFLPVVWWLESKLVPSLGPDLNGTPLPLAIHFLALMAVLVFIGPLVPRREKEQPSDSLYLWMSFTRPDYLRSFVLRGAFLRQVQKGEIRARDWDPEMMSYAMDVDDGVMSKPNRLLLAYYHALDSGRKGEALRLIQEAVACLAESPEIGNQAFIFRNEAAYAVALIRSEPGEARKLLTATPEGFARLDNIRVRALAAILLAESNWADALTAAQNVENRLSSKNKEWTGTIQAEIDWVLEIKELARKQVSTAFKVEAPSIQTAAQNSEVASSDSIG